MTRGPIDGVEGQGEADEPRGVTSWGRYLAAQDEQAALESAAAERAAEEAAAADLRAQAARAPEAPKKAGGGIAGAAAGAAAASLKAALTESPAQKRMDVLAALQAEALARLEIAPHADQVGAAQRATDHVDEGERADGRDLAEGRRLDQEEKVPDAPAAKKADARRPAEKYVAPARKPAAEEPARRRRPGEGQAE
jgi:hypothetical protein